MDLGITGKRALVTGASKGIGRAIAAELAAEGAHVAVSSRSAERSQATAQEIGVLAGLAWDAGDIDGAADLVAAARAALGGSVDILVCNTGGPPAGPDPFGFSRDQWETAYRSLVLAPMALVEACVPDMQASRWGRILNVVSTTVREPSPVLVLSNVHRAATLSAWKTISTPLARDGITVNSVLPGRIATDRLYELFGGQENAEGLGDQIPAGRLGTVEEMAAAATFLASARASYITGVALLVDGGVTLGI